MLNKIKSNNGRVPTKHEVDADKNMAAAHTFITMYGGTWNNVVREFGGEPRRKSYELNDLLEQVAKIYESTGKVPTKREFDNNKNTASSATVTRICGSYSSLIKVFLEKLGK